MEQRKALGAKFSHRTQKPGENIQEYAAELKRLNDKAHLNRDRQTRTEDLLRRFLDGLKDDSASFHVEYVKEPMDIDEAVNEVINFTETRGRPDHGSDKRQPRARRVMSDRSEDENEDRMACLPGRPPKNNLKQVVKDLSAAAAARGVDGNRPAAQPAALAAAAGGDNIANLRADMQLINNRVGDLEAQVRVLQRPRGPTRPGGGQPRNNAPRPAASSGCFRCGQPGHFARGCVNTIMGQFQMTTPLDPAYPTNRGGEAASRRDAEKAREPHAEGN